MSKVKLEIDIMYCKHCGKEIADDSTFCQHCGKQIAENKGNVSNGGNIIGNWLSTLNKKYVLLYAIWLVLNIVFLCFGKSEIGVGGWYGWHYSSQEYFFPFTDNEHTYIFDARYYDLTEFVVYAVLVPLLICYYFKYWHKTK